VKPRFVILIALVVVLGLGTVVPGQAQQVKSIKIAFDQEFDNLNPMYSDMYFTLITRSFYLAPAWNYDENLAPHPVLVTEIPSTENGDISADGMTLTLKLRDNVKWSDGEPLTSADFVFTYQMIMDSSNTPLTRYPYDAAVESVEAPDERTVVVHFKEPFAGWLGTIFSYVLPEHILAPVFANEGTLDSAEWNRDPKVGSGPYVFDQWETGSYVRFKRNDNYYDAPAKIDVVSISFIPDSASYVIALQNEDADVGTFVAYSDVPRLEESGKVDITIVTSGYNEAWFMNVREGIAHPAMLDVNVRKALVMAFNRDKICSDLLLGLTYPAASFWEKTPFASPNAKALPYDPEMAKQLLDQAGWVDSNGDGIRDKDGQKLSLRYVTNTRQVRIDTSVVAQQELKDVGVELTLQTYPSEIYFNGYAEGGPLATGQFDIAEWSDNPRGFPDPDTSLFLCSQIPTDEKPEGDNWTGYCDPSLDELFAEQSRTLDYNARIQVFHQIDDKLAEGVIWASIWHDPDLWVLNKRVQNAKLNGATPFWNIADWDIQ
jgi:peptide/nickel transport system substrate-binding protein